MKEKDIITELIRIADRLGIRIIEDKLLIKGDYCRVFDKKYLVMDRNISCDDKIKLLISALSRNNIEEIYLTPEIREMFSEIK